MHEVDQKVHRHVLNVELVEKVRIWSFVAVLVIILYGEGNLMRWAQGDWCQVVALEAEKAAAVVAPGQ